MFVKLIADTIKKYDMISPGDHIVVGVSGGADSIALLHGLYELRETFDISLTVAHLDHMIRGDVSSREALFVKGLAEGLDIPCVVEQRDVFSFQKNNKLSLQEAARSVRHAFFDDVLQRTGADTIALGHTADDQAETVLMWLLRGTSLQGLTGIPPVRDGKIIRPLLRCSRQEIEAYLREQHISFVADTSPQELQYERNRIRHRLIPFLRDEFSPAVTATLNRTADLLRQDNAILDGLAESVLRGHLERNEHDVCCALDVFAKADRDLWGRLIMKMVAEMKGDTRGITRKHIDAAGMLIEERGPSKQVQLPGGLCVWREYDQLIVSDEAQDIQSFFYSFDSLPECVAIAETGTKLHFQVETITDVQELLHNKAPGVEYLSLDAVRFPLVVRSRRDGDRFYPLGLEGSKKVQDLFSDLKIPLRLRCTVPILVSGDRIAWVGGLRIDERFKIEPETNRVLRIRQG